MSAAGAGRARMRRRRGASGRRSADRRFADKGLISAEPESRQGRRIDGAGDRPASLDQRDIDGELAVSGDEFSRSVERIDKQEPFGDGDRALRRCRFLGDDRRLGGARAQMSADDRLRPQVGKRDRTAVRLGASVAAALVYLHHRRPGGDRGLSQEERDLVAARRSSKSNGSGSQAGRRQGVPLMLRKSEPPAGRRPSQGNRRAELEGIATDERIGYTAIGQPRRRQPRVLGIDHRIAA